MAKSDTAPASATPETDTPANGQASGGYLAKLSESAEVTPAAVAETPEEVKAFVNAGHEHWQNKPKVWRSVELGTAEAIAEVSKLAREFASATGRTFRVDKKRTTDTHLIYKVSDKVSKGNGDAADDDSQDASDDDTATTE